MLSQSVIVLLLLKLNQVKGQDGAIVAEKFPTECRTPNGGTGWCIEIQKCARFIQQIEQKNDATFPFIKESRCGPTNEDPLRPKVCCGDDVNYNTEGCTTPNGEHARCVSIYQCNPFLQVLGSADALGKQFLKASVCRTENGVPFVCCGSATTYETKTRNSLLPGRDVCGIQDDSFKVFGGEDTGILEFPWMAALQYRNGSGHLSFKCAGALINERYVLTAAHCVQTPTFTLTAVRLGEWNLDKATDCVGTGRHQLCINPPIDLGVEEIIHHEDYTRLKNGVFYDIALLRLKSPVTYTESIRPICLPKPNEVTPPGTVLEVAGWGTTEFAKYSPVKQKVGLPIMDPSQCKSVFGNKGVTVTDAQICAGGEAGKDSCKGDSGGPLMATVRSKPSQYYAEGIVSFGVRCGTRGYPGIYTKVADYLDWINDKIRA